MMFKKLAIPFLALTLTAFGACSSSSSNSDGGTGGKTGTGGAGTGGAGTGGAGTGGMTGDSGTGGAGTGGATDAGTGGAMDAPKDMSSEVASETGGETGGDTGGDATAVNFCASGYPNATMKLTVAAGEFCAKYATVCTFGGAMRYADMADCLTKYMAAGADPECRAYHLCNAAQGGTAVATHCPHATGLSVCQ